MEGQVLRTLKTVEVVSPIDGSRIGEVPVMTVQDAYDAMDRARAAQPKWADYTIAERARVIQHFLNILEKRREEVADLITAESGKPRFESHLFEIASLVHLGDYFVKNAEKILKEKKISISLFKNRASYIHYRPRGVMLSISPWNFPLSISGGDVVMGLLAGNAVLLKPSSLTTLVALKLRELFDEAGLNRDVFQVITGPGKLASALIERGGLDYVSFTGSTETGRHVAELCAGRLIPYTLELGGKAPALVLPDANVEESAKSVVWGAFANSGQICASVERALVHESVYNTFISEAEQLTRTLRQGDPRTGEVDIGAITDPRQIGIVESLVADALAKGARVLTGGKRSSAGPNFYEPTILVDVTEDMEVMKRESFGPLLPVMKYSEEKEAIRIANDTRYGLMASVYSADHKHAESVADEIKAGTVIINDALVTHAYPETPWQGIKESGFGRVHSDEGLRDLCLSLHVNREVVAIQNPAWFPYTKKKLDLFLSVLDLAHRFESGGWFTRPREDEKRKSA